MKAILKGVVVTLVTLLLLAVMLPKARAGTETELKQLLEGKQTIHQGTCSLGAKYGFFEDGDVPRVVHNCAVGVDMNEPGEVFYALIMDRRNRPVRLIRIDRDKKTQTEIWSSRQEV